MTAPVTSPELLDRARGALLGLAVGDALGATLEFTARDSRPLYKQAGISETLDWVAALVALDRVELDPAVVDETLGILVKNQEDLQAARGAKGAHLAELVERVREKV